MVRIFLFTLLVLAAPLARSGEKRAEDRPAADKKADAKKDGDKQVNDKQVSEEVRQLRIQLEQLRREAQVKENILKEDNAKLLQKLLQANEALRDRDALLKRIQLEEEAVRRQAEEGRRRLELTEKEIMALVQKEAKARQEAEARAAQAQANAVRADAERARAEAERARAEALLRMFLKDKVDPPKVREVPKDKAANPPLVLVKGTIASLDKDNPDRVTVDVGADHGLEVGHTLEAYRLEPEPTYLGMIRILTVSERSAVGEVQPFSVSRRSPLKVGDRVISDLKSR